MSLLRSNQNYSYADYLTWDEDKAGVSIFPEFEIDLKPVFNNI